MTFLVTLTVAAAMAMTGCTEPAREGGQNVWLPGCHFFPPGQDRVDCQPDGIELEDGGQVPNGWYCSSPPFAGMRFYTSPTMNELGLHVNLQETSHKPVAGQVRTAIIHLVGAEREGVYHWILDGNQSFVIFPQWFGDEVHWRTDVIGVEYDIRPKRDDSPSFTAVPFWKTTTGGMSDQYKTFLLLHRVQGAGQTYFIENNSYSTVENPFPTGTPVSGYDYYPINTSTELFDFSSTHAVHLSGFTGSPMNVLVPEAGCLAEGVGAHTPDNTSRTKLSPSDGLRALPPPKP